MLVHVGVYIHTYIHTWIGTCIHTFIHTYMHAYIILVACHIDDNFVLISTFHISLIVTGVPFTGIKNDLNSILELAVFSRLD